MRVIPIKKADLNLFFSFVEEKDINICIPERDIYCNSVYFGRENTALLSWNTDAMTDREIEMLIKMLNVLLVDCKLEYLGE